MLKVGDDLLEINGVDVQNLSCEDANRVMKMAVRPITFHYARNVHVVTVGHIDDKLMTETDFIRAHAKHAVAELIAVALARNLAKECAWTRARRLASQLAHLPLPNQSVRQGQVRRHPTRPSLARPARTAAGRRVWLVRPATQRQPP